MFFSKKPQTFFQKTSNGKGSQVTNGKGSHETILCVQSVSSLLLPETCFRQETLIMWLPLFGRDYRSKSAILKCQYCKEFAYSCHYNKLSCWRCTINQKTLQNSNLVHELFHFDLNSDNENYVISKRVRSGLMSS